MADQYTFNQPIVTPSGTPLGGWVSLDVHSNGDFHVVFHMHSSSIFGDFDFDLRAYLGGIKYPVFFFHHSGHVSGVDDANYEENGNNPLIKIYWPEIDSLAAANAQQFNVAKDYKWGGIVGTLDSLITDLLDIGAAVAGSALGVVIGATREAIGWIGATLGPGATIGVIAGFAIFAVGAIAGASLGTALIVGTVAGVAAGVVSEALIKTRSLTPPEIAVASQVFGSVVPYDDVVLTNLGGLGGRAFTAPGVDGKTYCNLGNAFDDPINSVGNAYPQRGQLLVHELTHAWQIAHASFLPGFVCSGIVNQADYTFGDDVYQYGAPGPDFQSFNLEQQGAIVDQWYGGNGNSIGYRPMDQANSYYRYIWNDVLSKNPPSNAPANLRASSSFCSVQSANHIDGFWIGPDQAIGSGFWDANANNGNWSTPFPITNGGVAEPGQVVSISRFDGHLDAFWIGLDGAVMSAWWQNGANDNRWGTPFSIAPAGAAQPGAISAVARRPDHLDVFWIGPDGAVGTAWWDGQLNNGQWNPPFAITPPNAALPGGIASIARTIDHLDVFWIGPDGAIGTVWWDMNVNNGSWNPPFAVSPPLAAQPGAIACSSRLPDHVDVFWIGPDGAVGTAWWDANVNEGRWNPPFPITPPMAAQPRAITTVCRTPDHVDIFWIGPDGAVGTAWWDANVNEGRWNPPFPITPPMAAQPGVIACCSRIPVHVDAFWIGPNGAVGTAWWDANVNEGRWNPPFPITPPMAAQPGSLPEKPAQWTVSRIAQHVDVFRGRQDGSFTSTFWDLFVNEAQWVPEFSVAGSSTAPAGTEPSSLARTSYHVDLFWSATDGSIQTASWDAFSNDGIWNPAFNIAPPGSSVPGSPCSSIARLAHHVDVFWTGQDGAIATAWWDALINGGLWNPSFAITAPGAANPGTPCASVSRVSQHVDVFWVGPDGAIMSTFWDFFANNGQWVSPFSVAPAGSAQPGSWCSAVARVAHRVDVFWVAPNGAIMTTFWDAFVNAGQWVAPFAIAGPGSASPTARLTSLARLSHTINVFWATPAGAVESAWWDSLSNNAQWNGPVTLAPDGSAIQDAAIDSVARVPHHVDVFWKGPDDTIRTIWWDQFVNDGNWIPSFVLP